MAHVTAQISITKATTEGTWSGRVFGGWETYQVTAKGQTETRHRSWTLWFDSPVVIAKGDVVEFSGELGTKSGEYTKDGQTLKTVEHSVTNPRWTIIHKAEPKTETPAVDDGQQPF